MVLDNHVSILYDKMNAIGREYDFQMDKRIYQDARNKIKHFIDNSGHLIKDTEYKLFEDYCRQVFEEYIPKL